MQLIQAIQNQTELFDRLNYRSYQYNREMHPHVPVSGWKLIWGEDVDRFEARYQAAIAPREACPNVMASDSTGENVTLCGRDCAYFCDVCEITACSRSHMRDLDCTHEPKLMSEAVSA